MTTALTARPRLLPDRSFPAYAYLPGRQPHPVRDPGGHSHGSHPPVVAAETALSSEPFQWGIDLFNHGYYWEAHEAWEGLWQAARRTPQHRLFFKGLILLAATGVKLREGKPAAAARHAGRAAKALRQVPVGPNRMFERAMGLSPAVLAQQGEAEVRSAAFRPASLPGQPEPAFSFVLVPTA